MHGFYWFILYVNFIEIVLKVIVDWKRTNGCSADEKSRVFEVAENSEMFKQGEKW